ncbi:uncharacterized protein GGS22DRAFT_160420 [Annulohypoxylon maeteangense]|uniref:uncharacterized protein n=1 Tax=Annulohypoxylon maeteangense TaxID=1927788 RepID=UPI002008A77D|nr:uncharacterized protein GGS22DRAFT_160420 [Annulohypoxylon maeteangense]KAI0886266.1 hypothetical protein GGS22DRAFT_160420 [Annulohypoxylon maeteangense]
MHTINPPPRNPTPRRRPFVPTPANRAEPACLDRSHQGIIAAFEQSVKHTTQAIRGEEARAREADGLREELSAANKMLNDERGLSRVLTMQVEGIQKVLNVQHDEIKNHKQESADLRTLVNALQLENSRLMANEEAVGEGERVVVEELEGRIAGLESQVSESEKLNKALKTQLDEEMKASEMLRSMVKDTEKRVNAEWHDMCTDWCKELGEIRQGMTAFEARFVAFLHWQRAAREQHQQQQENEAPPLPLPLPQVQVQDFTELSSPSMIDAEWESPALAVHVNKPTTPKLDFEARVKQLEQKNRDLEIELSNVRHVGAELAGFYPLRRFHRHVSPQMENQQQDQQDDDDDDVPDLVPITTSPSSASLSAVDAAGDSKGWNLGVPDTDEEIPELRLPVRDEFLLSHLNSEENVADFHFCSRLLHH